MSIRAGAGGFSSRMPGSVTRPRPGPEILMHDWPSHSYFILSSVMESISPPAGMDEIYQITREAKMIYVNRLLKKPFDSKTLDFKRKSMLSIPLSNLAL